MSAASTNRANSTNRTGPAWFTRPTAAATASLAAVMFFIGLVGLAFLPREAQRLIDPQYVSVTHCIDMGVGRPMVSLFWSISRFGMPGWRHHLAVHAPAGRQPSKADQAAAFACQQLKPLSLARGPDPDHALVGSWDGSIYAIDPLRPDAEPARIGRQASGAVVAVGASADGRYVLSQSAFQLHAWDPATKRQRWQRSDVAQYCFVVRPDRAVAIVGTTGDELIEIDLDSGRTLRWLGRAEHPVLALALSPEGGKLAVLESHGRLRLLDSRTGEPLWDDRITRIFGTAAGRFLSFSPCGTLLATAGQKSQGSLAVWSVESGCRLRELVGHERIVIGAAFTQTGILHSWGADGTIREWNLLAGASRRVAELSPPPADG